MDPDSTIVRIVAVLVLIGINAILTASRFSLASARRSRIEPLARAGDSRAERVLAALDAPDRHTSATQAGIAASLIGIGWITHGGVEAVLSPRLSPMVLPVDGALASTVLSALVAVLAVVYVNGVIGERVPRLLAMQEPERIALRTCGVVRLLWLLLSPLLALVSMTSAAIMRVLGRSAEPAPGPVSDELRMLVEQSDEGDVVAVEQEQMLLGVIQLRDTLAREVMTPRRDIIALPVTASREETLALIAEQGHSRIPVYAESIDDIIGVLLVKDLLMPIVRGADMDTGFDLAALVREPYFVPDTKRIGELLPELRTKSVHMAIVLDEFGGTDGVVTLEDMLEEIVGDIYDEHDVPEEETDFAVTESGEILIDGGASIFDVNERFGLTLPEEDYDTIGGFVFGELGRVPVAGDAVQLDGAAQLRVAEVEERRVTRVQLIARSSAAPVVDGHSR